VTEGHQSDYSATELLDKPVHVKLLTCPHQKHCT